jgi:hypothetical protein
MEDMQKHGQDKKIEVDKKLARGAGKVKKEAASIEKTLTSDAQKKVKVTN